MHSQWPVYAEDERSAVARVLESGLVNYWTGGEGRLFEAEFARYVGVGHGVALANGTLALEAALRAVRIGAGDEVIVPARTFFATVTAVVAVGARPVFADVSRHSGLLTAETLEAACTPRTRGAIAVHLAGWPCDMDAIRSITDARDVLLIEDCAQAHGARWKGRHVGSYGDAAAFSFCTDKIISAGGEGGMLLTNDPSISRAAWEYKDHGRDWGLVGQAAGQPPYTFKWICAGFGSNWRLTEMQSALARVQLSKLDGWVAQRQQNAEALEAGLAQIPGLRVTPCDADEFNSRYKYYAYVEPEQLQQGWDRQRVLHEVNGRGVPCFQGICPETYLEEAVTRAGFAPAQRLPCARELGETSMMFQVDPTLDTSDMQMAIDVVREVMASATGIPA